MKFDPRLLPSVLIAINVLAAAGYLLDGGMSEWRKVVYWLSARTDARWWQEHVHGHADVRFIAGRLKFGNAKSAAPFPSAIAAWWGWPVLGGNFAHA